MNQLLFLLSVLGNLTLAANDCGGFLGKFGLLWGDYPVSGYVAGFSNNVSRESWAGVSLTWHPFKGDRARLKSLQFATYQNVFYHPELSGPDLEIDRAGDIFMGSTKVGRFGKWEKNFFEGISFDINKKYPVYELPTLSIDVPARRYTVGPPGTKPEVSRYTVSYLKWLLKKTIFSSCYSDSNYVTGDGQTGRGIVLWRSSRVGLTATELVPEGPRVFQSSGFLGLYVGSEGMSLVTYLPKRPLKFALTIDIETGDIKGSDGNRYGFWSSHPNHWATPRNHPYPLLAGELVWEKAPVIE